MSKSVSIIVPTFNRANSLPNTVNAVLDQSYQDFELIIINDGSSDDTAEVLDSLKSADSRIKVINKPNGGLSSARNAGLDVATGDYVIFLDDDDNVSKDYVKNLMDADLNIDLIIDSFSDQIDDGPVTPVDFPEIKVEGVDNILNFIFGPMQNYRYCFFAYAKRYRMEIIKKYSIRFSEIITFVEDRPFVLDYIRHAESMQVINSHSYIIKQTSSATYRLSHGVKPADYLIRNFRDSYNFLINYGEEYKNLLVRKYADNYLARVVADYLLIRMSRHLYSEESESHIIKDVPALWRNIKISNVKSRRNRVLVRMVRYIGVKACMSAMRMWLIIRNKK